MIFPDRSQREEGGRSREDGGSIAGVSLAFLTIKEIIRLLEGCLISW